ncbi:hypothetical protein CISG_01044 [Coccidioides immitis RMSCC 3703]|uniref:Protein transport protein SEC24 n=1 Tax=Coccidioides immitis RMSCC 3703 TaxID=454286 RepID=A0A0J8QW64_COCIT|nr:hypothetical protein CISG_01044 [Coccidioides immitis RMSCC 3703]
MAAPQEGYPPPHSDGQQGYGQPYGAPPAEADQPVAPPPAGAPATGGPTHGGRKKRAYAGQAFEFGSGANAALGGQLPGGGTYGGYPAPPQPQGYPPVPYPGQPAQPAPETYAAGEQLGAGGYQPPGPGYPAADVSQITQQMGQMSMGGQMPGRAPGATSLNQLYPTDLLAQSFNVAELDFPPPPVILPPNIISRCRRCRSYINPFVTFLDHGHRWRCNMCNLTNDVPQGFDWDATAQQALDRWQRPELNHAVVEFVAPQEYMVRPPQPLVYLFLIDVSYSSVTTGLLATAARCIKESLDRIPNTDRRTRLGFIAVDSSLHYFTIPRDGSESSDPSMLVVSDLDEPFLPIPGDLLVTLTECRENIEIFLDKLQEMFQNTQNGGSAMGSALRAGHKLIGPVGGKLTV